MLPADAAQGLFQAFCVALPASAVLGMQGRLCGPAAHRPAWPTALAKQQVCRAVRSASSTAASRAALPVNEAVAVEAWGGRPRAGVFASIRLEGVRGEGV